MGRGGAVAAHAHVERTLVAEGEPARGFIELHGGDAKVEHNTVDRVIAAGADDCLKVGEFTFHQDKPAAGRAHEVGTARHRAWAAVGSDDATVRRRLSCAAMAPRAEGG